VKVDDRRLAFGGSDGVFGAAGIEFGKLKIEIGVARIYSGHD
jgi:hypothetical protein